MTATVPQRLPLPAFLQPVAEFVRAEAWRFGAHAPDLDRLEAALCVHFANRSLFLVADHSLTPAFSRPTGEGEEQTLTGACVLWETTVAHLRECEAAERAVFDWTPPRPGDGVYCLALLTTTDAAMPQLAGNILKRFPHYRTLPLYAHRHGRLVNQRNLLERLTGGGVKKETLTPTLSHRMGEGGNPN